MELSDHDWERLDRYLSGRGTPEELAELERWVGASRERRILAESLRTAGLPAAVEDGPAWDVEAARRQVGRRMRWFGRPIVPVVAQTRRAAVWGRAPVWGRVAAAAAIVVVSTGAYWLVRSVSARGAALQAVAAGEAREVVTHRGERASFNLADGSKIMLGAETRLVIPASYNSAAGGRQLMLEGEGYFQVTHDSLRPFRVTTTRGIAEDLGTEFVVTAYPETNGMQVVVAQGRVAVRRPASPAAGISDSASVATMTAGDLARLDSTGKVTLRRVDPKAYLAWTEGTLVFDGTPLREALPRLARWYGVDVRLADVSLGDRPLTATFRTESAAQALDLIALSVHLRVERQGHTLVLAPSVRPTITSPQS